eukprot:753640-Hanusia_phi.AAC.1
MPGYVPHSAQLISYWRLIGIAAKARGRASPAGPPPRDLAQGLCQQQRDQLPVKQEASESVSELLTSLLPCAPFQQHDPPPLLPRTQQPGSGLPLPSQQGWQKAPSSQGKKTDGSRPRGPTRAIPSPAGGGEQGPGGLCHSSEEAQPQARRRAVALPAEEEEQESGSQAGEPAALPCLQQ